MTGATTHTGHQKYRRHASLAWFAMIALALALLAPVVTTTAAAAQTRTSQEACDPGFVRNERTGECEPITIPAQIQAPTEECAEGEVRDRTTGECVEPTPETPEREPDLVTETETPTEPPVEPSLVAETAVPVEPATLTLNKGACDDPSFDPAAATGLQAFLDACASPDGEFEFTITGADGFAATAPTELGTLALEIPAGTIGITETIPDGWGDPAVFCWSSLLPTPSDTPFIGNGPQWDVAPGEQVECWWFNVAEPPDATHTIQVEKRVCPDGFEVADDYWSLANGCQETLEGVGFAMTVDGGADEETTDASGQIAWSGVDLGASGQVQLTEEIPDGFGEPVVWCVNYPVEAADAQDFAFFQVTATGGQVTATPEQDAPFIFQCTFFNVLAADATGDLTDPSSQEAGEEVEHGITLTKRTCPAGTDPDQGLGTLLGLCAVTPGVEFTLEYGGGATSTTETDAAGQVSWQGLPYGPFEILEPGFAAYAAQVAYCEFEGFGFPWSYAFTDGVYDGSFDLGVHPEDGPMHLVCDWFNIESGEDGLEITVIKHGCPLGVPEDTTLDQYIVLCAELLDGISFTLGHEGGSLPGVTDDAGEVTWTDAPSGDITITETIPLGYKDPLAFCTTFAGEQELQSGQFPVVDGGIALTVPDDATNVTCWFVNLQDETAGSITIRKWMCPPGYEIDAMVEDPLESCTEPGGGVTFTIDDGNPPAPDQTLVTGEDQGTVVFAGLDPGTHTVTEEVPTGIEHATGWCASIGQVQSLDNPPRLVIDLAAGEHWECDWLNVPDDGQPEVNTVTMLKWRCPLGIPVDDFDQDSFAATCTDPHEEIEFTLESGAGSDTRATDESGEVTWEDIPAGPFSIQEAIPAGYLDPYVYCTYTPEDENALGMQWAEEPLPGGLLELEMGETADRLECHWYNVPDEDANNTITVVKQICPPGTSPDSNDVGDYHAACDTAHEGVDFVLDAPHGLFPDTTDGNGTIEWAGVPLGDFSIQETIPEGFGDPVVFCNFADVIQGIGFQNGPVSRLPADGGLVSAWIEEPGDVDYLCYFFNIPEEPEENGLTIYKWQCPEGAGHDESLDWYEDNCSQQHDGVEFTVTSDLGIAQLETAGGTVQFDGLPAGTAGIQETIPDGYGAPIVFCAPEDSLWQQIDAPTGHWEIDFNEDGESEAWTCYVFNIPGEPPSVTIMKWSCPPGYDLFAEGADPYQDCTEATNGIQFQFGPDDGLEGEAALQTTGDVIDAGVVFDDLEPGGYKAVEVVPDGIDHVFVLECTGHIMGVLQPYPLQMGNILQVDVAAGEHLTCHWFNVPEVPGGDLAVIKHICSTETFVDELDCEIYEDGATFDLELWDTAEGDWDVADTATTDGAGRIDWPGIAPGDYRLNEHDGSWCHLTTTPVFGPGDGFSIFDGEETVVEVYNCDPNWSTTTIPEKYPNTGAPPSAAPDRRLPAATLVPALLAMPLTRRRLAALGAAGLGAISTRALAQGEQVATPVGGTPAVVEPTRPCLPSTPVAGATATCARGPVPASLRIDAIGVDAPVEVLETVAGVMQQPTDEVHVAWYKESARIGEVGNVWIAGHLNWWNAPEAVFASLGLLRPGDVVELLDADGNGTSYTVAWVRQESGLEPPREAVLGMTDHPAVTLITCGGTWDSVSSEYEERTVVRAILEEPD